MIPLTLIVLSLVGLGEKLHSFKPQFLAAQQKYELAAQQAKAEASQQQPSPIVSGPSTPTTDPNTEARQQRREEIANQKDMLWWTRVLAISAIVLGIIQGALFLYQTFYSGRASEAATRSAEISALSLAITQRGFLQIEFGWLAQGDEFTLVRYSMSVSGPTPVTIIDGSYMRFSIKHPPFPPHVQREDLTQPIPPRRVSPRSSEDNIDIDFPALSIVQRETWSSGKLEVFLSGTIRYRDAFPGTPVHRKYFGVTCIVGKPWVPNKFVRNDEEDEDQGESAEYEEN